MNSNMQRRPCVYGLKVGVSFFYVGKTTVNSMTRFWEHRGRARNGHTAPLYEYMRSVGIENVEVVELDSDPSNEVSWIVQLLSEGHPLQNQHSRDGVEGSLSETAKRRIGDANAGSTSWIKGKTGSAAGWTEERRKAQAERITQLNKDRGGNGRVR